MEDIRRRAPNEMKMVYGKATLFPAIAVSAFMAMFACSTAEAQSLRTWVSASGADTNPCTLSAPCRTFQGAYSKTVDRGQISVRDAGEYGQVVISKSITIDGSNGLGRISPTSDFQPYAGIFIDNPGAHVILRGLEIHGRDCNGSPDQEGGGFGIGMSRGKQLHVENITISHHPCYSVLDPWKYSPYGIFVSAEGSKTFVSDTRIRLNGTFLTAVGQGGGAGIQVEAEGGAIGMSVTGTFVDGNYVGVRLYSKANGVITFSAENTSISGNVANGLVALSDNGKITATISDSQATENGNIAIHSVGTNALVRLGRSRVTNNYFGLYPLNGGRIQSFGDNEITGNKFDGSAPQPVTRR